MYNYLNYRVLNKDYVISEKQYFVFIFKQSKIPIRFKKTLLWKSVLYFIVILAITQFLTAYYACLDRK